MKTINKFYLPAFVLASAALLLTGCGSAKGLPEGFTEDQVQEQAIRDIDLASSNNYEGWSDRFQEDLKASLTEDSYQQYLDLLGEKGEFQEYGKCAFVGQEQDGKNYAACVIIVEYEKGDLQYTVGYNEDMELVQFFAK